MKKFFLASAALFLLSCFALSAAEEIPEPAPKGWLTSYPAASKLAKEKKLPLLLLFTGSDWCPACQQFDEKVLKQPEFEKFAAANLVRLYLDFPQYRKQSEAQARHNQMLANIFKTEGAVPSVFLIRTDGKARQIGFYTNTTAKSFVQELKSAIEAQK